MSKALKGPDSTPFAGDAALLTRCREWYEHLRKTTLPLIRDYHKARETVAEYRRQLAERAGHAEALLAVLGYGPQSAAAELATWKEIALAVEQEVGE